MTSTFVDKFFAVVVIVAVVGFVNWLWISSRKASRDREGEQWRMVEHRTSALGHVLLSKSENYGHWIVHVVPSNETTKPTVVLYATEAEAREAFAKVQ